MPESSERSSSVKACFILRLKPEFIDAYLAMHSPVWPEMLEAIRDAGWSNYTIFLRPDGTLVGYFETDDLDRARVRMASFEVDGRWAAKSRHFFDGPQHWLNPVFNLGAQLRASGLSLAAGPSA